MEDVEVLVLHGSPGSGKSTLANTIAEYLREADIAHAVIDVDELAIIHPSQGSTFWLANLTAIWPNYGAIAGLRALIPTVVGSENELRLLRNAVPAHKFRVCELVAPRYVLERRVTDREPNEHWQNRLRNFVSMYHQRSDHPKIRDFQSETHSQSVAETALDVLAKTGWIPKGKSREGAFRRVQTRP